MSSPGPFLALKVEPAEEWEEVWDAAWEEAEEWVVEAEWEEAAVGETALLFQHFREYTQQKLKS
ncbi:protein of unknown function [Thermococcus camini]|uniref:Uncharacterized protein n=1 Tax=Thermococcus camini TaxID=2016373 RepID=A0A7G2D9C4_9EURY|nr:protein of unknown function [Thermococcus camini]